MSIPVALICGSLQMITETREILQGTGLKPDEDPDELLNLNFVTDQ